MNNYNFGDLLEKSRRQNAIEAAKTLSAYCKSVKDCDKECIFYSYLTAECMFTMRNRYGYNIIPEDWEV